MPKRCRCIKNLILEIVIIVKILLISCEIVEILQILLISCEIVIIVKILLMY